ncbi:MAG: M20/M25/M40 family metallo-hydrolase [Ignavibacteriaceae bacterium]
MFRIFQLTLFTILLAIVFNYQLIAQVLPGYEQGLMTISEKEISENILFLASDSLKGRAAGSEENTIAAMFIANKFREYNLQPLIKNLRLKRNIIDDEDVILDIQNAGIYNEYFQRFIIKRSQLTDNNKLSLTTESEEYSLTKNYDYKSDFLIQKSTPENISSTLGVVFAGYGIIDEETDYNDYIDYNGNPLDIKNKAVVIIDGFPQEQDSTSKFSRSKNHLFKNIRRKVELAESMGALAVIVIQSPLKNEPPLMIKYENLLNAFERKTDYIPEIINSSLPVVYVHETFAEDLFAGTGLKLKNHLLDIDGSLKPYGMDLQGKQVSITIEFNSELLFTQNVIGMIEGSDPVLKDEFVVIGAHYDHIGVGTYGSMDKNNSGLIHNGADDNASGTTGIIELAEAFSKSKPKRSIVFIGFSGEENGLLGSKYYVYQQPLNDLNKTVAMINLDMVGRNEIELLWVGGAFYSDDLKTIVEEANTQIGFELLYNMGLLSSASDQAPFLRKEIPALFFFSGMHDDYHMPSDDVEKINIAKIEKVSRLAYLTGWILANNESHPNYRLLSNDEKAEMVKESLVRQRAFRNQN